MTHRRCCCGGGDPPTPLEDCPLGPFDFPSGCYSTTFRVSVSGVELQVCDAGVTCVEAASVVADVAILDVWTTDAPAAFTAGGSRWTVASVYAACLPRTWADHPDGVSDYVYLAVEFRYDAAGNPCGLDPSTAGGNGYDVTLFLVSESPRTNVDSCIPTGGYVPFGFRVGVGQQAIEPNRDVGDCAAYAECAGGGPFPGECVAAVGAASVVIV